MSEATSSVTQGAPDGVASWHVRAARLGDVPALVDAVSELLLEIGGKPPSSGKMAAAARALLADRAAGTILVAEGEAHELLGLLSASWQMALHIPGPYGLIQDLWVKDARRSDGIGAALVDALLRAARERGIARIEVGLPRPGFVGLERTAAFYAGQGFEPLGTRMRRVIA